MVRAAQPLHPASAAFLRKLAQAPNPSPESITLEQLRAGYDSFLTSSAGKNNFSGSVEALDVPAGDRAIPCRLYRPSGSDAQSLVLYFHGGGHVQGTLEGYDPFCRALSAASNAAILSVGYRLAPEHPCPAAQEDCFAALRWALEGRLGRGLATARVALAGDSAGGHLVLVTCLLAREGRLADRIAYALPLCPVADCRPACREAATEPSSFRAYGDGHLLTAERMIWFGKQYRGEDGLAADDWRVSPVMAELSGLPPMSVVTAGFDPLRDEGEAFAAAAAAAGSPVRHVCYEGEFHVWWLFGKMLPQASVHIQEFGDLLAQGLGMIPSKL